MKIKTLLIILLIALKSYSQANLETSKISTSEIEYNFLTKMYANDDEKNILPGYKLIDLFNETYKKYIYNYKRLVHIETNETRAILITLTRVKKNTDVVYYLCMPINNPDLFQDFNRETEDWLAWDFDIQEEFNRLLITKLIDDKFNI